MNRRGFLTLLSGTVIASPFAARAQQPGMPVIGFLSSRAPSDAAFFVAPFQEGLREAGFVDGQNVVVEYRWAGNDNSRLPALPVDLVRQQVAVIVAGGTVQHARTATTTIPIVFTTSVDPVASGLVPSLSRPGGNITGISFYSGAVGSKRLEILREVVPTAKSIGMLVNPHGASAEPQVKDAQAFASLAGGQIHVVNASSERDFDEAFATFSEVKAEVLLVSVDPLFDSRPQQLVALAAQHRLPAIYSRPEFSAAGGLMSYGASIADAYRQAGVYAGRILKGEKPAELPVMLPTEFKLVINLKTAAILGVTIPPSLLAWADEVIE